MAYTTDTAASDQPKIEADAGKPAEVHHFTDLGGFRGVIENGCLWASNVLFLNDSRELNHGLDAIKELIKKFLSIGNNSKWQGPLLDAVEALRARAIPSTYATCFCGEPDLLSLWRGYGGTRQGISISFDLGKLEHQFKELRVKLERVLYGDHTDKSVSATILNKLASISTLDHAVGFGGVGVVPYELQVAYIHNLVSGILPTIKHSGFKDEREWRFIAQHNRDSLGWVKFRAGSNLLIPYIELSFSDKKKLPITAVWVGPGSNRVLTRQSVEHFLSLHDYGNVSVRESTVPFRV